MTRRTVVVGTIVVSQLWCSATTITSSQSSFPSGSQRTPNNVEFHLAINVCSYIQKNIIVLGQRQKSDIQRDSMVS